MTDSFYGFLPIERLSPASFSDIILSEVPESFSRVLSFNILFFFSFGNLMKALIVQKGIWIFIEEGIEVPGKECNKL